MQPFIMLAVLGGREEQEVLAVLGEREVLAEPEARAEQEAQAEQEPRAQVE